MPERFGQAAAKFPCKVCAFVHGDALHRDKRADVHSAEPRVLTAVNAHVDALTRSAGSYQRAFENRFRLPDEGVDGAVGGGPRVHVQEGAARCLPDGPGDAVVR